ncbi:MAG: sulfotransferase family protein [Caulobacteraceae bacterium]
MRTALAEGTARQSLGRFGEAASFFERAIALSPDEAAPWAALAECLIAARRSQEAERVCEAALRRIADHPGLLSVKARALRDLGRLTEAAALFRRALARDPGFAPALYGLALQALEAGDWDGAETLAATRLAASGSAPDLDWLAARIALSRGDLEEGRRRAEEALVHPDLAPEKRAEILLLLGEILDRLGRPAGAFATFSTGKAILRALYAERAASRESEVEKLHRLAAWFHGADPVPWRASVSPGPSADASAGHVFLLGFPRSGTTLLEQALAGSPDIASLEEAPTLAAAYDEFLSSADGLERLSRLGFEEAETWRGRYWREVEGAGARPLGRVFLDKAPAGSLSLPLIAKLFPRAKVLFALRDPRDVVMSCFRNSFQMNAMTYAFTDLGQTAACYGASMAMVEAYRAVLTLDLLEVRHEALVADFETGLREVAAFLGLAFTPAMVDPGATARRRTVRTPSASQVRSGLNAEGHGRWRAYQRRLAPFLPLLLPWVDRFGYEVGG